MYSSNWLHTLVAHVMQKVPGQRLSLRRAPTRVHTRRMPLAEDAGELNDLNSTVLYPNTRPRSDSNATALHPYTLTSGPESGLCNMLMALVGY